MNKYIEPFPLEEITTPRSGKRVLIDYYWLTKDGSYFRSKRGGSLQCNKSKIVFEKVYGRLLKEGYEFNFLPMAYVDWDE